MAHKRVKLSKMKKMSNQGKDIKKYGGSARIKKMPLDEKLMLAKKVGLATIPADSVLKKMNDNEKKELGKDIDKELTQIDIVAEKFSGIFRNTVASLAKFIIGAHAVVIGSTVTVMGVIDGSKDALTAGLLCVIGGLISVVSGAGTNQDAESERMEVERKLRLIQSGFSDQ